MGNKEKNAAAALAETTLGSKAYALAVAYKAAVEPRLPPGMIGELAADLALLGAPTQAQAPSNAPAASPAAGAAPNLAQALATAVNLLTAIHGAAEGSGLKPAERKAFGIARKEPSKEPKAVLAALGAIAAAAQANPTDAYRIGIMPDDIAAIQKAVADLQAAAAAASTPGSKGPTAKEKKEAEARVRAAVGKIMGAGLLAFAQDGATRAEFEALKPKKGS